jgi:hypothetical protein
MLERKKPPSAAANAKTKSVANQKQTPAARRQIRDTGRRQKGLGALMPGQVVVVKCSAVEGELWYRAFIVDSGALARSKKKRSIKGQWWDQRWGDSAGTISRGKIDVADTFEFRKMMGENPEPVRGLRPRPEGAQAPRAWLKALRKPIPCASGTSGLAALGALQPGHVVVVDYLEDGSELWYRAFIVQSGALRSRTKHGTIYGEWWDQRWGQRADAIDRCDINVDDSLKLRDLMGMSPRPILGLPPAATVDPTPPGWPVSPSSASVDLAAVRAGWLMALKDDPDSRWGAVEDFLSDLWSVEGDPIVMNSKVWGRFYRLGLHPKPGDGIAFYHSRRARFSSPDKHKGRPRITAFAVLDEIWYHRQRVSLLKFRVMRKQLGQAARRPVLRDELNEPLFQACDMTQGRVGTFFPVPREQWLSFIKRAGLTGR